MMKPPSCLTTVLILLSLGVAPAARPAENGFGDRPWGLVTLSVASAREQPEHTAELGTQISLGHTVRLLQSSQGWLQVNAVNGYRAWIEEGTIVRCTREEIDAWQNGPLVIVTALETVIFSKPERHSEPVSDAIVGNLLKALGREAGWVRVALPDERAGYIEAEAVVDYRAWQGRLRPTPATIEATARRLVGRPYLWGGNSPKGLDCSGFVQLVYGLNGLELPHNASRQSGRGTPVELDKDFSQLQSGDLLFFGYNATAGRPEQVTHVGIYLSPGLVIHASERVQINRVDDLTDPPRPGRRRTLLRARRLLE